MPATSAGSPNTSPCRCWFASASGAAAKAPSRDASAASKTGLLHNTPVVVLTAAVLVVVMMAVVSSAGTPAVVADVLLLLLLLSPCAARAGGSGVGVPEGVLLPSSSAGTCRLLLLLHWPSRAGGGVGEGVGMSSGVNSVKWGAPPGVWNPTDPSIIPEHP
jgi:hypothetical protein